MEITEKNMATSGIARRIMIVIRARMTRRGLTILSQYVVKYSFASDGTWVGFGVWVSNVLQ